MTTNAKRAAPLPAASAGPERAPAPPGTPSPSDTPSSPAAASGGGNAPGPSLWLGLAMAMGGATLLANKGVLAKLLYAEGLDVVTLVAVRSALALPLFWAWAILRLGWGRVLSRDRGAVAISVFAGLACYYVGALVNFESLRLIDASLERVLLYAYPSLVLLAEAFRRRRLPPPRTLLALALTYAGIVLAVGVQDADLFRANAWGAALALLSGLGFAVWFLLNQAAAARIGSVRFTVYAMTAASAALVAHLVAMRGGLPPLDLTPRAWWLMALMVLAVTVLPLFMVAEGVRRLGAERAALVSSVGPPTTIAMAWLVLGEVLTPLQILGAAIVIGGILVLEEKGLRALRRRRGPS